MSEIIVTKSSPLETTRELFLEKRAVSDGKAETSVAARDGNL